MKLKQHHSLQLFFVFDCDVGSFWQATSGNRLDNNTKLNNFFFIIPFQSQNETPSTSSSASKKADNEKLYTSVLDMYRPIIVNKSVSSVPGSLATDEAYATNIIFDAVNAGETIQYSFADINKDGKDELLIGSPERVHAIYYLNNTDQPVFAISAGTYAKGGYLSDMKIYSDGTIYCQQFQRMRPEAKAETYEIKNGAFNQCNTKIFP